MPPCCCSSLQAREAEGMETDEADAGPNQALDADIIPQETLRKYIAYAKANCRPKLQNADYDKISQARSPPPAHAAFAKSLPPWDSALIAVTLQKLCQRSPFCDRKA